jgi:hypothetical protein
VACELETRWNEKLRAVAELEEEHRQEQSRDLSQLTEEKGVLRSLVGDVATRWHARETTVEDPKRLLRCLIREVVLTRGEGAKGAGGVTTLRIGWKSGAWTTWPRSGPAPASRHGQQRPHSNGFEPWHPGCPTNASPRCSTRQDSRPASGSLGRPDASSASAGISRFRPAVRRCRTRGRSGVLV